MGRGARVAWGWTGDGAWGRGGGGRMGTREKGGRRKEGGRGALHYTGQNMIDWHGAAAGQALVQINVGFGGATKWLNEVTDAEYNGK